MNMLQYDQEKEWQDDRQDDPSKRKANGLIRLRPITAAVSHGRLAT
jgi:hypothetical protein